MNLGRVVEKHNGFQFFEFTGGLIDNYNSSDLPEECWNCFRNNMIKKKYRKGEVVISEFEKGKGLFYIHSGLVRLSKQDELGNEFIVDLKKEKDIFAETSLFNGKKRYYAYTATMLRGGEISFVRADLIEDELTRCPKLSRDIIKYVNKQLEHSISKLFDMANFDSFLKTVSALKSLVDKFGKYNQNVIYVDLPITIQDFAGMIGSSRESVSRVFSKLENDGVLLKKNRRIIFPDWERFLSLLLHS